MFYKQFSQDAEDEIVAKAITQGQTQRSVRLITKYTENICPLTKKNLKKELETVQGKAVLRTIQPEHVLKVTKAVTKNLLNRFENFDGTRLYFGFITQKTPNYATPTVKTTIIVLRYYQKRWWITYCNRVKMQLELNNNQRRHVDIFWAEDCTLDTDSRYRCQDEVRELRSIMNFFEDKPEYIPKTQKKESNVYTLNELSKLKIFSLGKTVVQSSMAEIYTFIPYFYELEKDRWHGVSKSKSTKACRYNYAEKMANKPIWKIVGQWGKSLNQQDKIVKLLKFRREVYKNTGKFELQKKSRKIVDKDSRVWFGQYVGKTIEEVIDIDLRYFDWMFENMDIFDNKSEKFRKYLCS